MMKGRPARRDCTTPHEGVRSAILSDWCLVVHSGPQHNVHHELIGRRAKQQRCAAHYHLSTPRRIQQAARKAEVLPIVSADLYEYNLKYERPDDRMWKEEGPTEASNTLPNDGWGDMLDEWYNSGCSGPLWRSCALCLVD